MSIIKQRLKILAEILVILMLICVAIKVYGVFLEKKYTIYKIGDNSTTMSVKESELDLYVNDTYEWSIEPTTLMYATDGTTSWIWESEVEMYLSTGNWYLNKEDIPPKINVTMNAFERTNIPASELEKMLIKGLSGYGQTFYEMERLYGINSIFAISVAELESGNGTSSAFKNKNNAFGIGPGMRFSSVENGIYYFGDLMTKSTYYGKSIDRIGSIYCVGGNWASKVKSLMKRNYAVLGY